MSEFERSERNDTFSIGITFEEINEILMKNPSKNKEAYDRLTPIVEQKRKAFITQLKSKISQKNAKISYDNQAGVLRETLKI